MGKYRKDIDYDFIEENANDMIEDLGEIVFPLNCFNVARKLGISLKEYSDYREEDKAFLLSISNDGFCVKKINQFVIAYNDENPEVRIKFTIWHEIGHIQLGHLDSFADNVLSVSTSNKLEKEADYFARYVLAPLPLICLLGCDSVEKIATSCKISHQCAGYVFDNYNKAMVYPSLKSKIMNNRIRELLKFYFSPEDGRWEVFSKRRVSHKDINRFLSSEEVHRYLFPQTLLSPR